MRVTYRLTTTTISLSAAEVGEYNGEGAYVFGASVDGSGHFVGKMHGARIWDKVVTPARLQTNSLTMLEPKAISLLTILCRRLRATCLPTRHMEPTSICVEVNGLIRKVVQLHSTARTSI